MATDFDLELLMHINQVRNNPSCLNEPLNDLLSRFDSYMENMLIWPSGHKTIQSEGKPPIIEVIEYLKHIKPLDFRL